MFRTFWIRDSMHLNSVGLGNPTKRTCATCHGMHMTGMDTANGWMDIGTTNLPWAKEVPLNPWNAAKPEMPLFKVTCKDRRAAASVPGPRDLHAGSGPRADLRPLQRRGHHRDAAAARPVGPRAVFLQWLGRLRCARSWTSTTAATTSATPSRRSRIWSTSWGRCEQTSARSVLRCMLPAAAAQAAAAATRAAQFRRLPHRARHGLGALLAGRVRRRAVFPHAADRCQRAGESALAGPSRCWSKASAATSRASAAASCSSRCACR